MHHLWAHPHALAQASVLAQDLLDSLHNQIFIPLKMSFISSSSAMLSNT
jgi:hypothetical protein